MNAAWLSLQGRRIALSAWLGKHPSHAGEESLLHDWEHQHG
jgi:hypothetical protein